MQTLINLLLQDFHSTLLHILLQMFEKGSKPIKFHITFTSGKGILYGRCTSFRGSSRNHGVTRKNTQFFYSYKLSNEIPSVTVSLNVWVFVQGHDVGNDVIMK